MCCPPSVTLRVCHTLNTIRPLCTLPVSPRSRLVCATHVHPMCAIRSQVMWRLS